MNIGTIDLAIIVIYFRHRISEVMQLAGIESGP